MFFPIVAIKPDCRQFKKVSTEYFKGLKSKIICAVIKYMNPENFTSEDEAALRDALKRCSEQTIEKAVEFRKTGNVELVGPVVMGIIERFLEPEKREALKSASDSTNMIEDLGLDSLTMVEIVLAVEDAIGMSIDNDDIQKLKTLGDIKNYIKEKVSK